MNGVEVFRNLFSAENHADIKQFVSKHRSHIPKDHDALFQRQCSNDVPYFRNIHNQLVDFASEKFGTRVKPSYSFLSMYENNGTCPLHIDRRQCRFTIDYLIQQDSVEPWPIKIGKPLNDIEVEQASDIVFPLSEWQENEIITSTEWETVELNPNDAVFYSGTHSWHYRPLPLKGTADLVFFHFVSENFQGTLQ